MVRNKPSKMLTPQSNGAGYYYVVVSVDKKRYNKLIHRLVAEAFIPNPNNYPEVNHINEIKSHNYVRNLEWCDKKHNMNTGTVKNRISNSHYKKVIRIDKNENKTLYNSISFAAKDNNVSISAVSKCITGINNTCKGYRFIYADDNF